MSAPDERWASLPDPAKETIAYVNEFFGPVEQPPDDAAAQPPGGHREESEVDS